MNIGFFGDSPLSWTGYAYNCKNTGSLTVSWNDMLCKALKATQFNTAVLQGSTERTLISLKQCKIKLDLAIVSISNHRFTYLPRCDIDHNIIDNPGDRAKQLFEIKGVQHGPNYNHYKNVCAQFSSVEEFVETFNLYRKHFYDPQLQLNRQAGALQQIDQWLCKNEINTIYISNAKNVIPAWVELKAGKHLSDFRQIYKKHRETNNLPNSISFRGQTEIAGWFWKKIINETD